MAELKDTLMDYIQDSCGSDGRDEFLARAQKFWELYRSEQWWIPASDFEPYEGSRPVDLENRMMEKVETVVSVFFKHLPVVELHPHKVNDYDVAREQNKHIQYAMTEADFLNTMRIGTRETMITGMCIYHTGWDASKLDVYENGDCSFHPMSHDDVFLDPHPDLMDIQKSRFVALRFWLPQDVVLERFGNKAAKALGIENRKQKSSDRQTQSEPSIRERLAINVSSDEDAMEIFDPKGDVIPVYEVWYRTADYREEQLAGGKRTFKRLEPLGRVAHLVNGEVVLDKPHPFRQYKSVEVVVDEESTGQRRRVPVGHGQFPVVRQVAYQVQNRERKKGLYEAMGILEQLESLQWTANDIARQMSINARTIANPPTIVSKRDLIHPNNPESLVLFPSQKIIVKGDRPVTESVHIQQPPSIPSYVQYVHQMKHELIDRVSGVKGFVAGNIHKGTSHTTAEGTNLVSEADFSMMWTLIHNTESAMVGIIRQFAGLMQQFYKTGRYIAVTENGQTFEAEWGSRNISAEFTYSVISGSSTPQQDIKRVQNVTFAQQVLQPVLQNPTSDNIRLAIFALEAANLPWTGDFLDYLREKLEDTEQQERATQQTEVLMDAAAIAPQQQSFDGINRLATELGTTPDALLAQLAAA